jgi:hypothetical protein
MKIIRLQAEGFKRLVAVDISPEGDVVEVRGNNAEGKSSVLDSIFAALGGAAAMPIKPVRTGEEYALIRLDLGDLKVTRYFSADGTDRLKVENAEGASYAEPQTMLNKLVGRIAFDPLAFARMKPAEQSAELRRLVPLKVDLDALAKADKADLLARRDVNRDARALEPRIAAIVLPDELPAKPDRDAIVEALGSAGETNAAIERERVRRADMQATIERRIADAVENDERVASLRAEADRLEAVVVHVRAGTEERKAELAALPLIAELVDTAKLSTDLSEADKALAVHRRAEERKALEKEFEALRVKSSAFSTSIEERAALRDKALAEAEMPVPGLSLATVDDEQVVTFEGEPFSQSSGAQQLRVSMALAMAANPKLRIMLIKDGSLLDKNGLQLVRDLAAEREYQIWLEAVGEGDGVGIIMEGGKVKGAPEPERAEAPKRRKPKAEAVEPEKVETNAADHDVAIVGDKLMIAGEVVPEVKSITSTSEAAPEPAKPARRKPTAMREFNTKPLGGDLFGGGKS